LTEPQAPTAASTAATLSSATSDLWRVLITAAAYFLAERASCELAAIATGGGSTVCLGLAIALVAVVLYGYRMVAGVVLGAAMFRLSIDIPAMLAVTAAAGEGLIVLAAAAFLRRRGFDARLIRISDVGAVLATGVLGVATVGAGVEVATALAAEQLTRSQMFESWMGRWTAISQGVVLATPLFLTWLARPIANREALRSLAVGIGTALFLALSPLLLSRVIGPQLARDIVVFAFFPIALWAAYRFEPREATLINVFVAVAAIVGQSLGLVEIANESLGGVLVALHGFIACFALTTLTISVINVERHADATALAASEARFRSLTEMANDWYWEQDSNYRFTMASHGASSIGVDSASIIGRCLWELPFEVTPELWAAHRNVLEARRPFRDFMLIRRLPSGEIRYFLISGDPVQDGDSRLLGYRGVVREITSEKWAEEAMRESEQRYASVFFNSSAAIIVVRIDPDGGYQFESCNQSAESLLDIPAHELVGNAPAQCLPDTLADDLVARFDRCLAAEARVTEEHNLVTRAGSKHVVVTLVPIRHMAEPIERIILIAIDISEQRRVEQRARESEQMFTRVFHASPVPMAFSRFADGVVTEVNAAWLALFGGTREMSIGRTIADSGMVVALDDFRAGVQRLQEGDSIHHFELAARRRSGAPLDILYSAEVMELGGEKVIVSSAVDVTDRKRNEEALRHSQERFSKVFHASPVPMFVMAYPDQRYIEVNDAWTAFFGFSRDETIGKTARDLRTWVPPQGDDADWSAIVAGHRVRNSEQRVRKKSGEVVDALVSAESIDLAGEAQVITTLIDITTRKVVERQLRDSERRFRDFAEAAGEYVWEVDARGIYSYVSNRVEAVTGFKPEEIIGRRPDEFMPLGEGVRVQDWVNANRRPDHSYRNLEHRAFTKSGSSIWQLVNAVPILDDKGVPTGYRGTALDITERKQAEQRIEELATRDPLTGLPNRRQFEEQLVRGTAHAQRSGQLLALMFIDLDKFKTVNDTLGHQVGDSLLREVARRLSAAIRKGDTLSRFGGDEFVILLEGLKSPGDAGTVAQKIVAEIGAPCEIEGHQLVTGCSIGISVFPNDAADISTLMRHADAAMYAAKAGGRETYRYFSAEVQARTINPSKLGFEIRIALDRDEFRLMYQPRVAIADGRMTSVQATLRWRHPQRGLLTPERFVKIAEEAGLSRSLGEWTLDRAALQAREWRAVPDLNLPIAVGLTGIHLSASMLDMLRDTIDRHAIDAQGIEIELSETTLMRNIEESRAHVMRIRDMNVKVLIEDFGTGFSSVQYLRRLPVSGVKIAPIFVRDIVNNHDDRAIVRGLIGMARSMDMAVIAEGVDTIEQLDVLRDLGCTEFSGAHFMPAVPPLEFEQRVLRDTNIARLATRRPASPE
jgi:diguanylate cyclase (GGDEF)-like protein/PAS domain S-box-containing protein